MGDRTRGAADNHRGCVTILNEKYNVGIQFDKSTRMIVTDTLIMMKGFTIITLTSSFFIQPLSYIN